MKVMVISLVIGTLGTIPKRLVKGMELLEITDYPNYSIIKIGKNTEKSPGDLRGLAVTQIPEKSIS